jgi:hypothetical protein
MGKDKYENEALIKYGLPEDVWFHVDDLSSAHVYLRMKPGMAMDDVNEDLLLQCSSLVKANSIAGCKVSRVGKGRHLLKLLQQASVSLNVLTKLSLLQFTESISLCCVYSMEKLEKDLRYGGRSSRLSAARECQKVESGEEQSDCETVGKDTKRTLSGFGG